MAESTLIEGIGDEVVYLLSAVLGGLVLLVAWISTHVHDEPAAADASPAAPRRSIGQILSQSLDLFVAQLTGLISLLSSIITAAAGGGAEAERPVGFSPIDWVTPHSSSEDSDTVSSSPPSPDQENTNENARDAHQSSDSSLLSEESTREPETTTTASPPPDQAAPSPPPDNSIRIRIKFLNETERIVVASPQDRIADLKTHHFREEVESNKLVRFIFKGRQLPEQWTLSESQISDMTTIHCLISEPLGPRERQQTAGGQR